MAMTEEGYLLAVAEATDTDPDAALEVARDLWHRGDTEEGALAFVADRLAVGDDLDDVRDESATRP